MLVYQTVGKSLIKRIGYSQLCYLLQCKRYLSLVSVMLWPFIIAPFVPPIRFQSRVQHSCLKCGSLQPSEFTTVARSLSFFFNSVQKRPRRQGIYLLWAPYRSTKTPVFSSCSCEVLVILDWRKTTPSPKRTLRTWNTLWCVKTSESLLGLEGLPWQVAIDM